MNLCAPCSPVGKVLGLRGSIHSCQRIPSERGHAVGQKLLLCTCTKQTTVMSFSPFIVIVVLIINVITMEDPLEHQNNEVNEDDDNSARSSLAVVSMAGENTYLDEDLIQDIDKQSDFMNRTACHVVSYGRKLYNCCFSSVLGENEKSLIQSELNNKFKRCKELIEISNDYFNIHYIPWKEMLIEKRIHLRNKCEQQFSLQSLNIGLSEYNDTPTDNYRAILRRYNECSEAYHLSQVVERRFVCNTWNLANTLDSLAETAVKHCGLSNCKWRNTYSYALDDVKW